MLSSPALKELQKLINFTQIRFNCFKANKGREIDLATAKNTSGYTVVKYSLVKLMTGLQRANHMNTFQVIPRN